jgi:hypothetical protein
MRSQWVRGLAASAALSMLSGCMFVQWTDHAFIGSPQDPPTHVNREWAGVAILPLALAGDIITAPFQAIAVLVRGDYGIYARPHERVSLGNDPDTLRVAGLRADGTMSEIALTADQRVALAARLQGRTFDVTAAPLLASN